MIHLGFAIRSPHDFNENVSGRDTSGQLVKRGVIVVDDSEACRCVPEILLGDPAVICILADLYSTCYVQHSTCRYLCPWWTRTLEASAGGHQELQFVEK